MNLNKKKEQEERINNMEVLEIGIEIAWWIGFFVNISIYVLIISKKPKMNPLAAGTQLTLHIVLWSVLAYDPIWPEMFKAILPMPNLVAFLSVSPGIVFGLIGLLTWGIGTVVSNLLNEKKEG